MSKKVINVFISHIHEDDNKLSDLRELLRKHGCEVRDSSITSDKPNDAKDPNYIMNAYLKPGIDWARTLIVLISPGTKESAWVDSEIEYARQKEKRIVGVWDYGAKDCDLPAGLEDYSDAVVVGWRGERLVDAVLGEVEESETASGEPAFRAIQHYNCGK